MRLRRVVPSLVIALSTLVAPAHAQVLYWIDTSFGAPTLNQADPNGFPLASVALPAGTQPEGLAIDAGGKLYWAEGAWSGARIERVAPTLSASSIATIVPGGSALRGIAVDDVDHYLYWTTSNLLTGARIQRSGLDGSGAITLIALGPGANPRGIAVDHVGGKLYWADFDQNVIYRANLNGTVMEPWQILPALSGPWGVAFDPIGQQIYWTEYAGKLRHAPTLTGAPFTLFAGVPNPTYLTIDTNLGTLYWADAIAGGQHLERATLGGAGRLILPTVITTYGGLAFQPHASVSTPGSTLPAAFALDPVSPNPARGAVRVTFAMPREAQVRLSVLDLQGREVAVLADGVLPAGRHDAAWDDAPGRPAPAGVYFVRFAANGHTWVRRIVRVR